MIKLSIDSQNIEIEAGSTILQAAQKAGIEIPTLCFYADEFDNHPSCMICVVKDLENNELIPSCAYPASEGMQIETKGIEIETARKEALELLLSDHSGDCHAPCQLTCPAGMDIAQMNRYLAAGEFGKALEIVHRDIPMAETLGYICPAPCEKACKRSQIDQPVAICQLKKAAAKYGAYNLSAEKPPPTGRQIAILGAGIAGLSAAFFLQKSGHQCVIFDSMRIAGGSLHYKQLKYRLPKEVIANDVQNIHDLGAEFVLQQEISPDFYKKTIENQFDAVVLALGANEEFSNLAKTLNWEQSKHGLEVDKTTYKLVNQDNIFACGSVIKPEKMAVRTTGQAHKMALAINDFLQNKEHIPRKVYVASRFNKFHENEPQEYLKEAISDNRNPAANEHSYDLSENEVMTEAARCLHCDCRDAESCKLKIYSEQYQANNRRFSADFRPTISKNFSHNLIIYETAKCIKCNICVQVAAQYHEEIGLTPIGRGFQVKISTPPDKNLQDALSKAARACANACPTSALVMK